MSDSRFARIHTDPRFRRLKKSKNKVVVDERFKSLFDGDDKGTEKRSKGKGGRVDKYGRRISDNHEKDNLRRFYRLEGENDKKAAPQSDVPQFVDYARGEVLLESSDEDSDGLLSIHESDSDKDDVREIVLGRHASKPIPVLTEEEDLEVDLKEEDDDAYADLDAQAAAYSKRHALEDNDEQHSSGAGTKTCRLAIVNLDWDHVRASHLYRILSSLVSPAAPSISISANAASSLDSTEKPEKQHSVRVARGKILSVRVYPSEFGKERMRREEFEGPPKEIFKKGRRDDGNLNIDLIQEDEGDEFNGDVLRKYQLERLRYYYAIVTCDSVEAAAHIISELDGTELERSANVFDLSYVPNDMEFDDNFRDEATPATDAAITNYAGLDFSTEALRHSKVTLKWDEDDPERYRITGRALTRKEIEDGDYQTLIASSDSEDEDDEDDNVVEYGKKDRESLRKLLLSGVDDDMPEGWSSNDPFGNRDKYGADGEVEITFMPGLSEAAKNKEEESTLERYKRKQKEKRQQRKKERKEQQLSEERTEGYRAGGLHDGFFGEDSEETESEEDTVVKRAGSKARHKMNGEYGGSSEEVRPATEAELELLVASEDDLNRKKHFDIKSIIKAEKLGKKGKKGKKSKGKGGEDELQGDFQIDVNDERFKALHEDHAFAIDPSNPHFKKTKSMNALLEERTRRQGEKRSPGVIGDGSERKDSLQSLVERVKRKSRDAAGKGNGKRRKAD